MLSFKFTSFSAAICFGDERAHVSTIFDNNETACCGKHHELGVYTAEWPFVSELQPHGRNLLKRKKAV